MVAAVHSYRLREEVNSLLEIASREGSISLSLQGADCTE